MLEHTLNTKLIEARKDLRWSQQEVADRLGTTQHNVSRWERGVTFPGPYFRAKLCTVFGRSAQELGLVKKKRFPSQDGQEWPQGPRTARETSQDQNPSCSPSSRFSPLLPLIPLVGREKPRQRVAVQLLQPQVRLLTLTGLGGIGKTLLALFIAQDLQQAFRDGVCFVELAATRDPDLVLATVAEGLSLSGCQRPLVEGIQDFLRDKQLWLVLDNFEQVIRAAPQRNL